MKVSTTRPGYDYIPTTLSSINKENKQISPRGQRQHPPHTVVRGKYLAQVLKKLCLLLGGGVGFSVEKDPENRGITHVSSFILKLYLAFVPFRFLFLSRPWNCALTESSEQTIELYKT